MLKMKDLLQEGRQIQELFKKNVLSESETITSKFNSKLFIKVGDDSITFITPFGNITFEVAGQYDDFSTDGGVGMSYTAARGGISQAEWKKATERIFDFVSNESDYLKATKKLLDPKVLTMYLPQITKGAKFKTPGSSSTFSSKAAKSKSVAYDDPDVLLKMTKIPTRYWEDAFEYTGKILKNVGEGPHGFVSTLYDFVEDAANSLNNNKSSIQKYFKSLSYKNGLIISNYRGREEKELQNV